MFTGNTFYYTYAALCKKMTWIDVWQLWVCSYAGNILGAAVFAFIIFTTGLYAESSVNGFLLHVVEGKMQVPTTQLFFRGILFNWLVCMAFFLPLGLKGDGAKMFAMMLFVFLFLYFRLEHSIANMCTFAIDLVLNHPGTISWGGVIHNRMTIGNPIGGSVFMGMMYYYANKPFLADYDRTGKLSIGSPVFYRQIPGEISTISVGYRQVL